jgi:hypothetical protein
VLLRNLVFFLEVVSLKHFVSVEYALWLLGFSRSNFAMRGKVRTRKCESEVHWQSGCFQGRRGWWASPGSCALWKEFQLRMKFKSDFQAGYRETFIGTECDHKPALMSGRCERQDCAANIALFSRN